MPSIATTQDIASSCGRCVTGTVIGASGHAGSVKPWYRFRSANIGVRTARGDIIAARNSDAAQGSIVSRAIVGPSWA